MARLARAADVGMATLYRNFAGLQEVLEALYAGEVTDLVDAASVPVAPAGEALRTWLRRFMVFHASKHSIAIQLLQHTDRTDPLFESSRDRVLRAGRPLLERAQATGEIRDGVTIEQVLDLVLAAMSVPGDDDYRRPILQAVIEGLRAPGAS
jgi:AcrR family transcriptional regulator